jgi:hypothetical protein
VDIVAEQPSVYYSAILYYNYYHRPDLTKGGNKRKLKLPKTPISRKGLVMTYKNNVLPIDLPDPLCLSQGLEKGKPKSS